MYILSICSGCGADEAVGRKGMISRSRGGVRVGGGERGGMRRRRRKIPLGRADNLRLYTCESDDVDQENVEIWTEEKESFEA